MDHIFGPSNHFDLPAGFILWPIVFIVTDIINEYFNFTPESAIGLMFEREDFEEFEENILL